MMYSYDFRKIARDSLRGKWGLAVLAGLVATILGGTQSGVTGGVELSEREMRMLSPEILTFISGFAIVSLIITILIGGVTEIGYTKFNMNIVRDKNPQFTDILSYYNYIKKGVGLTVIRGFFVFLWSLLFVVPGIVAFYRYAMMPYLLAENPNMTVMEAMKQSKIMMKGNKFRLFCLHFTFIGWKILAAFTLGIGFLWVNPYEAAAEAAFFDSLSSDVLTVEPQEPKKSDFDYINWEE